MPVSKLVRTSPKRKSTSPFNEFSKYENGKRRNLKFDVNALADFEQETGMGFGLLMKQRAVFASARAMLWAGLKHEDRALTIEDVGDLLGQYIKDEEAENQTINTILMVAITAAVDQGALGKLDVKKAEAVNEEDAEDEAAVEAALHPNDRAEVIEASALPTTTTQDEQPH